MHTIKRSLLILFLPLVLLVAACSGGGASPSAASVEPTVAPSEEASPSESAEASPSEAASPSESAAGEATVVLGDNALGAILVDAAGMTLYGFSPDEGGTPTCYEDCAAAWPPLLAEAGAAPTAGEGLDASLLTTVDRTDGTTQVAYNGWPLYYFANDAAAGDTNGQGLIDVWWVVGADGAFIGQ